MWGGDGDLRRSRQAIRRNVRYRFRFSDIGHQVCTRGNNYPVSGVSAEQNKLFRQLLSADYS